MNKTKPFSISKKLVMDAFKLVKANAGGAGVDKESIAEFERDLKDNLYKIWNRMSSGSYYPPLVKAVSIPKKAGGQRILGVPTVGDRVAQMVVKLLFELEVEPYFYSDSYGYRPNKSALDAIGITRERCWKYDWVLEFDIKGLFDNIDHSLLMKAVRKHTENKWVLLYIERWLKAPMQLEDGSQVERSKGTPQGGVVSPLLSNLFLHYVFDNWMSKEHKSIPWCRYADDGLAHCKTEREAKQLLSELKVRFERYGLELHPEKTKIIYCKDDRRKGKYSERAFNFLGYTFRGREVRNGKTKERFLGFVPAVSKEALKSMRARIRKMGFRKRADMELEDIAKVVNPVLNGWLSYYGKFSRSAMHPVLRHFNMTLVKWAMRKFKKLRGHKTRAVNYLVKMAKKLPDLFAHWKIGMVSAFT